jgi:hypothetical protein
VNSTPSFYVDGALQPPGDWSTLAPVLRAKGLK